MLLSVRMFSQLLTGLSLVRIIEDLHAVQARAGSQRGSVVYDGFVLALSQYLKTLWFMDKSDDIHHS